MARAGVLTAIGIAIHNFPEGIAVLMISLESISLGIPIALAIAVHNVPEGISVSVPIYYATGDKRKAFKYSFFSGVAEPLGAAVGFLVLMPFLTELVLNVVLAGVAGIMVFISFDELLPISKDYGNEHLSSMGLFSGMFIMMLSLAVLWRDIILNNYKNFSMCSFFNVFVKEDFIFGCIFVFKGNSEIFVIFFFLG